MSSLKSARVVLAAATAILFAGVSVAAAQARLEVTPFAGYYIASDLYNAYSTTGNSNVELTNSGLWGVKLSATGFRGGIEFSYTRTGSDIHVDRTLSGQPRQDFGRVDIDSYDINFLGYQPSGNPRVTPIGIVGFGWSVTHPQIDTDFNLGTGPQPESHTLFNFNFGLGVKVAMSERLSTRIEGRWRVTDTHLTTDSGFWCDPWGYCYNYSTDWYNSGEEFCAILPETALANAAKIGEELRALVEAHAFVAEDKRINVTISIGAGCLREGMEIADLYRCADEMLYQAKRTGRNKVCH